MAIVALLAVLLGPLTSRSSAAAIGATNPASRVRGRGWWNLLFPRQEWQNGAETVYTRDQQNTSGCIDALSFMKDLAANPGNVTTMSLSAVPNALQYGVEISYTNGSETFHVTDASLTVF